MDSSVNLVHRSATRRKSCRECVRAKRRCDLTLPSCSRCTVRGLTCHYNEQGALIGVENKELIKSTGPVRLNTTKQMALEPSPLGSPLDAIKSPNSSYIPPERASICVSQLRLSIGTLIGEGRTMFIHPSMYEEKLPKIYQDLLSVCSLSLHITTANRARLAQIIDLRIKELVAASKTTVNVVDLLLNVQVLIMYQIVQVFDDHLNQLRNTERDFNLLSTWTNRLHEAYSEEDTCTESESTRWILHESIRRTLMISIMLRCLYLSTKNGNCDLIPLMAILPVSNNCSRWYEEHRMNREDDSLVVYAEYVENWNKGKVAKLADYELMLLRACRHAKPIDSG